MRKSPRILISAFFFLFFTALFSAPVKTVIHGAVPGAAGRTLRLYEYSNQISYYPVKTAEVKINNNDNFSIELQIGKGDVKTLFFAVERYKSFDMYAEAGKTYNLVFDSLDYNLQDESFSPLTSASPGLVFQIKDDPNDLNNLISELVFELMWFSVEDFSEVMKLRNVKKMEHFYHRLDSLFGNVKHPFFKTALEYSFAELELNARLRSNAYFVERYFNDKPFQYENPAFMNLFNTLFDKFIYAGSRKITFSDLEKHIVQQPDYKSLLDSLGKDTLLKNEVVRDMVLIKNLHQLYFSNLFHRESVCNMMKIVSEKSKFPKHRQIASSLLNEMTLHFQKQPAPPLLASQYDGKPFSLDSLKGKYIYLLFFTTYCKACFPEMIVLNNFYPKYSSSINVLFVSMDVNFLKFYYFMQDYGYPWHFVNFNRNFEIEDEWGVKVYPHAFMIDPDLNIINRNAPLPSEFLEKYFADLLSLPRTGN